MSSSYPFTIREEIKHENLVVSSPLVSYTGKASKDDLIPLLLQLKGKDYLAPWKQTSNKHIIVLVLYYQIFKI